MGDALTAGLPDWLWREKTTPPRALDVVGDALYGAPSPGSRRAWLAWLWVPDEARGRGRGRATLDAVVARAKADGATKLTAGGPPGNYVCSGVDRDAPVRGFLVREGFVVDGAHLDLTVDPRGLVGDPTVSRGGDEGDLAAIERAFGVGWAHECRRAREHDGLFVHRGSDGALAGFVAHSGNRVRDGVFGPVGVMPDARGGGLGARLTRTALADLAARGHASVVVPWVAPETARFYRKIVRVTNELPRESLSRAVS